MEKNKIDGFSMEEALKALNEEYTKKSVLTEASNSENGNESTDADSDPDNWEELKDGETMDDERNLEPLTLWHNTKSGKYVIIIGSNNPWDGYSNITTFDRHEAFAEFRAYLDDPMYNESVDDSAISNPAVPAPYDKYFTVSDYDPEEFAGEYLVGDTIENYDSKLLAYLEVKPEYEELFDGWALLVDDPEFPVVELAGGRMYPLDIKSIFDAE